MKKILLILLLFVSFATIHAQVYEMDIIPTSKGNIEITHIAHGTLMMKYNNLVLHIDPVRMFGTDYSKMPKADLILITHTHPDHLDTIAIAQIRKENTSVIVTAECAKLLGFGEVMANGDHKTINGISIDAVPAYNLTAAFHPKGIGNGYVLMFGDKKVYVAGDTENIPEMSNLKNISVAFLPMNQPTMSPEQVAEATRRIRPEILYPYHYGESDPTILVNLLKGVSGIEIRIRNKK